MTDTQPTLQDKGTGQDLGTCVVCRDRIENPGHIKLGDLIAHEHCREYVNARTAEAFDAGQIHDRRCAIEWLRSDVARSTDAAKLISLHDAAVSIAENLALGAHRV